MTDTIIRVEELSKKYMIKHKQQDIHPMLRDIITNKVKAFGRTVFPGIYASQRHSTPTEEEFWALKDVSFDIKQGEVVGIIGSNGAGKSTLLKLLSRITEPTTGRIHIKGRIASLLEVGTGFHPELTGRENIFLNGAILGMSRVEIIKKFDEIVAFAEVEKFLDTPVKRYSSGMYVRLAFAVAAHLEPEILLVDEVLAVGDAAFQKKCMGKMRNVAQKGRTIFFVSHKMDAIRRICSSALLIKQGKLIKKGTTEEIIDQYLTGKNLRAELNDRGPVPEKGMHLRSVKLIGKNSTTSDHFLRNELAHIEVVYDINAPLKGVHVVCHIVDNEDRIIVSTGDCDVNQQLHSERTPGSYLAKIRIPTDILNEGEYSLTFSLGVPYGNIFDQAHNIVRFALSDSRIEGGPKYIQKRPGLVIQDIPWITEKSL